MVGAASAEAAALTVIVEDAQGYPVEGAQVWITNGLTQLSDITDQYGEVDFNNIPVGWWDILITRNEGEGSVEDEVYVDNLERRRHIIVFDV
jgi:hypothetical protein